jgi:hypothetical protein
MTRALARALVPWRGKAALVIGELWIEVDLASSVWAAETEPKKMLKRLAADEFTRLGRDPFVLLNKEPY